MPPLAVFVILFRLKYSTAKFIPEPIEPLGFRAIGSGVEGVDAMSALEKKHRDFENTKETAEIVLVSRQTVIGMDVESLSFEIAVVTHHNPSYPLLGVDEVLKAIATKTKMRTIYDRIL
jgi:hypothetical protein